MSLEVNSMVQKNSMENSECILCGSCVDNCPKQVIKYSFGKNESKTILQERRVGPVNGGKTQMKALILNGARTENETTNTVV